MGTDATQLPPPCWAVTAWLNAPSRPITPAVAVELRKSMFRRLEAVIVSTAVSLVIALIAACRHTDTFFKIWLVLDLAVFSWRVSLVVHVWRRQNTNKIGWIFGAHVTDHFILCGTLWCALWGLGESAIMLTGDEPLMITAIMAGTAILGALCVRNPSSSRLNAVQIGLIMIPFSIACFLSGMPIVSWFSLLGPVYMLTLSKMARQVHDDYTAMIVAQLENRDLALHCPLTGLPNRRHFDENLVSALGEAQSSPCSGALLCIDLDGFKSVNDRYGHSAGDALLVQVAERLNRLIGKNDFAARLGGDEFAVFMPAADCCEAETLAEKITMAIAEPFDLVPRAPVRIGASVGILVLALGPGSEPVNASLLLARADQALYEAKRAGKGIFRRYDHNLQADSCVPDH
jgi:diguanylate cyclase (GGDEF)-like protein